MSGTLTRGIKIGIGLVLLMIAVKMPYLISRPSDRGNGLSNRTVEIVYSFTIGNIPEGAKHIIAWVPIPLSDGHQKLLDLNVHNCKLYRTIEESEYGNKVIVFDLSRENLADKKEIEVLISFDVTRYAIGPAKGQSSNEHVPQYQLARYLAPDRMIPISGKIAKEAYETVGAVEDKLAQSRMLYDHIVETLSYDKSGTGWGRGDALYACEIRKGNCTDFHSLFIGQARALRIPARFIMGLPLPEDKGEGSITGYHCWGEFYLPKKGWLPLDASQANKFPEKKDKYFAQLDEHRIAFSIGRDIKLPGIQSEPLNYMIYPHVEIDGKVHNDVVTSFYFKDFSSVEKISKETQ